MCVLNLWLRFLAVGLYLLRWEGVREREPSDVGFWVKKEKSDSQAPKSLAGGENTWIQKNPKRHDVATTISLHFTYKYEIYSSSIATMGMFIFAYLTHEAHLM